MFDMKTQDETQLDQLEQVSALMDGRLSGAEFDTAMQSVGSGELRDSWHLYHVIGDVLRSSELAACQHDARFVSRLSEQLKLEAARPARIEPLAAAIPIAAGAHADRPAANDGVFRWKLVAGLASFAAVAAIGWGALGSLGPQPVGSQMAQNAVPAAGRTELADARTLVALPSSAGEGEAPQVMLRDPRLDEMLAAHLQASGASALRDASGFLRNATFEGSGR
ncbi:MAG: sigma-E factor negative regulatory protein [Ottowia sp.]|uniref:sigma-E factor negative regulatory protein n=1 Tax=Ottowia sp. TaxID=1898956 RepID=UPI003C76DCEF